MSSIQSIHIFFGLPQHLYPSTVILNTNFELMTCRYHANVTITPQLFHCQTSSDVLIPNFVHSVIAYIICLSFFVYSYCKSYFLATVTFSIESKHEVTILGGLNEFCVKFFGPPGSELIWFKIMKFISYFALLFNSLRGARTI